MNIRLIPLWLCAAVFSSPALLGAGAKTFGQQNATLNTTAPPQQSQDSSKHIAADSAVDSAKKAPISRAGSDSVNSDGDSKRLYLFGKPMDTILVLTAKTQEAFLNAFTQKHRTARQRGYGGCIGFSPGMYWIDMDPVRDLVRRVKELNDIKFDLTDQFKMLSLTGGLLYGGLGNGMRIGLEGRGGSRTIAKDMGDTTYFMNVSLGYGGLLLEKSIVAGDLNIILGGVAGGGGMTVERRHTTSGSGFSSSLEDTTSPDGSATAAMMMLQLHAGFTYSILSWIHVGCAAVVPVFFSPGGFHGRDGRNLSDGFTTLNYGLQLRLMLGNLG